MRLPYLNSQPLNLLLAIVTLVAMAAIACNGDGSSDASPSPKVSPTATATATASASPSPNASATSGAPSPGASPQASPVPTFTAIPDVSNGSIIEAVGSYTKNEGLDGTHLDSNTVANCQVLQVTTPTATQRLAMGQFCLSLKSLEPGTAKVLMELPETDEAWELEVEYEADSYQWRVANVDKVRG